jgi:hypothetical protein
MFILLFGGHSISIYQLGNEVFSFPKPSLFVKEGGIRVPFFKITKPGTETSNRSFQ